VKRIRGRRMKAVVYGDLPFANALRAIFRSVAIDEITMHAKKCMFKFNLTESLFSTSKLFEETRSTA
jgi:hypothetical protein